MSLLDWLFGKGDVTKEERPVSADRLICVKCERQSDKLVFRQGELVAGYTGFGLCPKCRRIWCSSCYVQDAGEVNLPGLGRVGVVTNQCPECRVTLTPPIGR